MQRRMTTRTAGLFAGFLLWGVHLGGGSSLFAAPPGGEDYRGDLVVRVVPESIRALRTALAVTQDVWSHGASIGRPLDIRVDGRAYAALVAAGLRPEVLIPDLGGLILAERARIAERQAAEAEGGVAGGDAWFEDFRTLAQIEAKLDELAAARPDIATLETIGLSLEGRPIRALRISASDDPDVPQILINGCQHAREWVSPATVMFIATRLLEAPAPDPAISALLAGAEILVVPMVNPDGYQYSWDAVRLWRKNRRNNGNGTFGVDLNRNWDFAWGGPGASSNPASETYRGPAPFSEPESQALRDFYLANPRIVASIDFHSYSQLVLSPWGYTLDPSPDAPLFDLIGDEMAAAIFSSGGANYVSGPIGSTLYIASGSIVDWAYGERGAIAYTIELRDTGEFGFILPPDQILPTAEENLAAFLAFGAAVAKPAAISFPAPPPSVLAAGEPTSFTVKIRALAGQPIEGEAFLRFRVGGAGAFVDAPLSPLGDGLFAATLPAQACGATVEYFVAFGTTAGAVAAPEDAPASTFSALATTTTVVLREDFEVDAGWIVGGAQDTATSGQWVRVDPNGTTAQPEDDTSPDGTLCFVTGNAAPGSPAGAADVDNGITTLTSPLLDASHPDSVLIYDRWYSNNLGAAPNQDSMPIEISGDGGATWTLLELVTENAGAWVTRSFRVADFVAPTASLRVRFVARDLGAGSLVEAGVDEVRIVVVGCPSILGDLDGDGAVGAPDLAILLGQWGGPGSGDLDGDGEVGAGDLAILLGAWEK